MSKGTIAIIVTGATLLVVSFVTSLVSLIRDY